MDPTTVSSVEIEMQPLDEPFFIPMDIFPDQVELFVEAEVENIAEEPQVQENSANSEKEPGVSQQRLQSATPISSPTSSRSSTPSILLEELQPFPKAGPRTAPKNNGRRKITSAVLTDTPVKSVIEAEKAAVITKAARKVFPPEKSSKSEKNSSYQEGIKTNEEGSQGESFILSRMWSQLFEHKRRFHSLHNEKMWSMGL
jgi:hypothetical protein